MPTIRSVLDSSTELTSCQTIYIKSYIGLFLTRYKTVPYSSTVMWKVSFEVKKNKFLYAKNILKCRLERKIYSKNIPKTGRSETLSPCQIFLYERLRKNFQQVDRTQRNRGIH